MLYWKRQYAQEVRLLEKELEEVSEKRNPLEETLKDCKRILALETLKEDTEEYFQWLKDIDTRKEQLKEKQKLSERLESFARRM